MFYILVVLACNALGAFAIYHSTNTLMCGIYALLIIVPDMMFYSLRKAQFQAKRDRNGMEYFRNERDRIDRANTEIKAKYDHAANAANTTADLMEGLVKRTNLERQEQERKISALRDEINRLRNNSRIQRMSNSRSNRRDRV